MILPNRIAESGIVNMHVKLIVLLTMVVSLCVSGTGCYDAKEIDEMAYAIAVGLDKGRTNDLRVTILFAVPESSKSDKDGGLAANKKEGDNSGKMSKSSKSITVEGQALYSSLNIFNSFMGKQVNLSHVGFFVISQELVTNGDIHKHLHSIVRGRDFRPSTNIMISRCPAEEFIESIGSDLHSTESRFIEMLFSNTQYNSMTVKSTIYDFYTQLESTSIQAVAALADINRSVMEGVDSIDMSTHMMQGNETQSEGDFLAGNLTRSGGPEIEVLGLAVFKDKNMVGMLDGEDASYYRMARGKYNRTYWTISDPLVEGYYIILDIKQNRYPQITVDFDGSDSPYIMTDLFLEADFVSIQSGKNYEDVNNVKIIEDAISSYLQEGMTDYLYTTSEVFRSDINGFGTYAKMNFLYWQDWIDSLWFEKYEDSRFVVNVSLKIRRPELMIRSVHGK